MVNTKKKSDFIKIDDRVAIPIVLRHYAETDVSFIMNSWLKSMRDDTNKSITYNNFTKYTSGEKSPNYDKSVSSPKFYSQAHPLVTSLLERAGAIVACDATDYDHIYGYIVAEHLEEIPVVHWIYIKAPYRRNGIAKLLYEHVNPDGLKALATFHTLKLAVRAERGSYIYDPKLLGKIFKLNGTPIAREIKLEE